MTPKRKKRLMIVIFLLLGFSTATALALKAFNQNMMFFYTPTEIHLGKAPQHGEFRLGGMVVKGSVKRQPDSLTVQFDLTDMKNTVTVAYTGILPDLFREGQGIIARGSLNQNGGVTATQVLAKHDEKYMPPEVAEMLKKGNKP